MTAVPLDDLESNWKRGWCADWEEGAPEIRIKPQILGLILRWGDRIIDASVKKKLGFIGSRLKTV